MFKPTTLTYVLLVLAMVAMAMLDNVRGVFVPSFKTYYTLTNTHIGMMFLISSLAYMVSSYTCGYILKRTHQKNVLIAGAIITISGILTIALAKNTILFFLAMILMNVGIAAMGIAINTAVPLMQVTNQAVLMNGVHFLYGIGATLTQKTTGLLLGLNFHFKQIYLIVALFFSVMLVVSLFTALPRESAHSKNKTKFTRGQLRVLLIFALALGLYVAGELQTGNWLVNYLKTRFQYDENTAANFTATFFLLFSLGRLFGGFIVARIGYMRSIYLTTFVAVGLYTTGLILGAPGTWLIAASGLFFSIVYPTVMLAVASFFKESMTSATGIIITISSGVNMLMSPLIGTAADVWGIQVAMYIMPACLLASASLILLIAIKGKAWAAKGDV